MIRVSQNKDGGASRSAPIRVLGCYAALVVVASVVLAGCGATGDTIKVAAPKTEPVCELQVPDDTCRAVALPGGRLLRYAKIAPNAGRKSPGITLVDLGGPGYALFGTTSSRTQLAMIANATHRTAVALEEPWVQERYPSGCKEAVSQWFVAEHAGRGAGTSVMSSRCDLESGNWGWSQNRYKQAVAAVSRHENALVRVFVGVSFGSERLRYLEKPPATAWLLYPASATSSADRLLSERAELTPGICSNCAIRRGMPRGRSIGVTAFDAGAALVATAYQEHPARALDFLRAGNPTAQVIGALSDSVTNRYAVNAISPATFAYWQETCHAYGNAHANSGVPASAARFLWTWQRPCADLHQQALGAVSSAHVCLVVDEADHVVPRTSAATWRQTFVGADMHTIRRGIHGLVDARVLRLCSAHGGGEPPGP